MPIAPCKDVLNECFPCAGTDPSSNTSAEGFDANVFIARSVIIKPPQINKLYAQQGCKRWCYSLISQADAQACADAQATECVNDTTIIPPVIIPPVVPPVGFPVVTVVATEPDTTFGEDPGVFTLTRTGSFAQPLTVQFALSGTATNGVDYQFLTAQATIDAGDDTVDVIVIPEDTDEVESQSVILTVLGTAAYSAGAHNADTVTISPADCGTDSFRVDGYGPALASAINAMVPDALASDLPEWDGILRLRPGESVFQSNSGCYAINGKGIELIVHPPVDFIETAACSFGWVLAPSGCSACVDGSPTFTAVNRTYADVRDINSGDGVLIISLSNTIIGSYVMSTGPRCPGFYFGFQTYQVGADQIARRIYGNMVFNVVNL